MKSGRANRWATREFEQEAKAGRLRFLDWDDFEDKFRKDCMPLDAEAAAINVLETTTYFQGKRSVDNYLDQFRDLIYDSGYTDPKGGTHSCNHYGLSTARGRLPTEFPTLRAHPTASP